MRAPHPALLRSIGIWFALAAGLGAATANAEDERAALELKLLGSLESLGEVEIRADEARISATDTSTFSGHVEIVRGEGRISAAAASYDPHEQRFSVEGDVEYEDTSIAVSAGEALFDTETDEGEFKRTSFQLKQGSGQGDADSIRSDGQNFLVLDGVRYSACPPGEVDWRLIAKRIRLDKDKEIGAGRNVRVEFKGVPILYAPYITFPASGARKSGFLMPDYGNTDRSGNQFALPYYWNIAPNYDATITARHYTDRGSQLGVEARYLLPGTKGTFEGVYLDDDRLTKTNRSLATWQHQTALDSGLRVRADVADVSDSAYFQDLSSSLAATSVTHLERFFEVALEREDWLLAARAQAFQTVDDTIGLADRPYKRLPQLVFAGHWEEGLGLDIGLHAELAHFERDLGTRGQRFDVEPSVSLPIESAGFSVVPTVSVNYARYALDDLPVVGALDNPTRTTPIYSLDGRLIFERLTGRDSSLLHTLEPRLRYTHIPHSNQDELPVFDTGLPDFNQIQLFQDNRYAGVDRIGDTDKLSVGVTTRLFDTRDGRELVSATLGQAIFLSQRAVQIPDRPAPTENSSNLIAEVDLDFSDRWKADIEYQWAPDASETAKVAVRIQYRPADNKVLNVGYRFQDNDLEQSDLSFAWPLGNNWSFVGRWNYSLQENATLERFAGVEYERCCWAARLVSRRFVNDRDGGSDTALFVQFELKGLTSIGTRVDAFLERGILGYGKNR